jgi:putative ABC transport system permease protein
MSFLSFLLVPAVRALARNKMRSGLTTLGIVIGVSAVIATVSIGQGAGDAMQGSIASLGSNMLIILPGSINRGGLQVGTGQTKSLTRADEEAIRRDVPELASISGGVQTSTQAVWATNNWFTQVLGVEPSYFQIRGWNIGEGAAFNTGDVERATNVALIGETVRRKLFGLANPLGQVIRIKNLPFRVVGTLAPKGNSSFGQDQDDVVLIPLTTAQRKVIGITWFNWVAISAKSQHETNIAKIAITQVLRERHRIELGSQDDFAVQDMAEFQDALKTLSATLTLLLVAIASVALVVGGIGIMNIMLVSVTERTREIGIRISIGATERDVQLQFLIEAIVLSVFGGVVGVIVGELGSWLIDRLASWHFTVSITYTLLAVIFSAGIGIVFGFYPARRASRLNPIEALRYE